MNFADLLKRFPEEPEQIDDGVLVHCPAHADSKASLRLTVSEAGKVLLRCRAGCRTTDVLEKIGLSLYDLATMTPEGADFERATSTDAPAGAEEIAKLAADLDSYAETVGPEALDYAAERFGLTQDDFARLGLGEAHNLGGGARLVVPFRDPQGVPRGFQARALAPDAAVRWLGPKSPEGASWSKLAWFAGASGWDEVLVTEGPGDALTGVALGYDTVGVRGAGLASNPTVVDEIAAWIGDRVAVLAGDGDPAGRTFSSTLAQGLIERGVRSKILELPDGHDLTDWRRRDGGRFASEVIRGIMAAEEVTSTTATLTGRDLKRYPLTDLGNARFVRDFVVARSSGVRFSPEAGFFLLDAGVWRTDKLDRTRAYVQEAADTVDAIAKALAAAAGADTNLIADAKRWLRWSTYSQSTNGINAAIRELQALPGVAADVNAFDNHPHLLACRNGVVNLRTGALLPHDPTLLLTRRVELDYDPAAQAPRWEAFLREVFPSYTATLPDYMRRLVGYGITGSTAEQCFAVFWGTGANGKSVFTDTLTEVFRELTVTTPFSTFEERGSGGIPNDLAALKGSRLVMAAEGEQGRPMAEAVLKRVTGRDLIAARFMRKEFFEFRPTFLLLLATNFKPSFRGQDEGLWRRVKLIPWARYFAPAERDPRLGETLLGEAQGIFAWAVRGAQEWFANGLQDPDVVRHSTREYRETSDVLTGFFPGSFERHEGAKFKAAELFRAFQDWADEHNMLDLKRWSSRAFYAALEERGLSRKKSHGTVFVFGIRRARQTSEVPDHDEPETDFEEPRAEVSTSPHSPSDRKPPLAGPSLADVL